MKKSTLHQIAGVLVEAGRSDLAESMVVESGAIKNLLTKTSLTKQEYNKVKRYLNEDDWTWEPRHNMYTTYLSEKELLDSYKKKNITGSIITSKISIKTLKNNRSIYKALLSVDRSGNYVIARLKDNSFAKGLVNKITETSVTIKHRVIPFESMKLMEERRMSNDKIVRKYIIEL